MTPAAHAPDPAATPAVPPLAMPVADDPPLPDGLSPEALRRIASADAWDRDRFASAVASARRAWIAAGCGGAIGVLGLATAAFALSTPPAPPLAVVVDRTTGQSQVISKVGDTEVPSLAVLDQHNAAAYVRAREAYHPALLQRDYDAVARMSTPDAFKAYNERWVGDRAQHKVLGTSQEHRIAIVSVRPTQLASPGRPGEAVVTFDREVRHAHGQSPTTTRHLATVRYEYRPTAMTRDVDRIENPFGFLVTAYRVDAELGMPTLVTPTPAPLPAATPTVAPAAPAPANGTPAPATPTPTAAAEAPAGPRS